MEEGLTGKEATIVGSVLAQVRITAIKHAAVYALQRKKLLLQQKSLYVIVEPKLQR
jgi:hypothetical protein